MLERIERKLHALSLMVLVPCSTQVAERSEYVWPQGYMRFHGQALERLSVNDDPSAMSNTVCSTDDGETAFHRAEAGPTNRIPTIKAFLRLWEGGQRLSSTSTS